MKNLEKIAEKIEAEMDEKDAVREVALKSSRSVIRLCNATIRMIHKDKPEVTTMVKDATEELDTLLSVTRDIPELYYSGIVESAMQEYVEAKLLLAISNGSSLPGPEQLNVTNEAYLLGVGDVIGEVRRLSVESLRHGEVEKSSEYLDIMEELFEFLMRFHYPASMVAIKRKQDVARGVIEKTRGEVAVATRAHALEMKISETTK